MQFCPLLFNSILFGFAQNKPQMIAFKKTNSKIVQNDLNNLEQTQEQLKGINNKNVRPYVSNNVVYLDKQKNDQLQNQRHIEKSENLSSGGKRQKMPNSLKKSLQQQAIQSGKYKVRRSIMKKSKFGQMISEHLKKQSLSCGICMGEMEQNQNIRLCNCNHFYCANCLSQYVLYKVKMFEEVMCPNQQCQNIMSQQNNFYKSLPEDTKTKYIKIHNFYKTSKDSSLRLCPKQGCEGVVKIIQNQPRICDKCLKQFCPKCYFEQHEGLCDKNQIDFFQNNLHYRQCSNCKFVIQRTEGCNHMTCKCKYQFCYVCGNKWSNEHVCNRVPGGVTAIHNYVDDNCFNCNCLDGCCLLGFILKFPLKLTIWLIFMSLTMLFLGLKIAKLMAVFSFVVIAGATFFAIGYTCQICDDSLIIGLVLLVFYPIVMLIGICKAIGQIFLDVFR